MTGERRVIPGGALRALPVVGLLGTAYGMERAFPACPAVGAAISGILDALAATGALLAAWIAGVLRHRRYFR